MLSTFVKSNSQDASLATILFTKKIRLMLQNYQRKLSSFMKQLMSEQHLKRTMILALVSVFGYYSMFNVSGAANQGSGVTGAPFNSGVTCTDCHSNSNYGSTIALQLLSGSTVITNHTPGQAYTVRITRSANATFNAIAAAGWGFQMACATGTGNTNNNGWGTLPTGVSNKLFSSRNYIEHNQKLAKATLTLDIPWTAPSSASVGTANFYIALNNVNGNGSTSGDQVVTTSMSIPAVSCPTPTVSIAANNTTICSGTSVTFTATPTNGGTTPTYVWKNNGTAISGATSATYTSTSLANGNQITCVMTPTAPCNTSSATSNTVTMTVNPLLTPSVSIAASSTNICSGNSVTFTATPTNGGGTPTYSWKKNGTTISGATAATFSSNTLSNNDVISVDMTTSTACFTVQTVSSNNVTMTVNANLTPSVSIAESGNNICAGTSVTFTATPTNGGSSPTYQWKNNGTTITGATNATYSSSSLANGDVITVVMTTSIACFAASTATSNGVTMVVNSSFTPSVAIAASNNNVCAGTTLTFTAIPTNGGNTPTYQWYNNSSVIAGETNATYTTSSTANSDVISVVMGSSMACASSPTANSNNLTMVINPIVTPSVIASTTATTVCPAAAVTFNSSVTNGGNTTQYQWMVNSANINGATGSSYIATSGVNDADVYSVAITSNANCLSTNTATSNGITMSLTSPVATITPSGSTALCSTANVTLTASNGASYLWSTGATTQSITVNTAGNYSVAVTSFGGCVSNSAATNVQKFPTSVKIATVGLATVCEPLTVSFKTDPTIGFVGQFNYQWNLGGTPITGATDSTYVATGASAGSITLTLSGATCTANSTAKTYTIKAKPSATFTAGGPTTFCAGGSVTLTAPVISGYTYAWLKDGLAAGGGNSKVLKLAGVYKVIAKLSGCSDTSSTSVTLVVNPLPVASVTNTTPNTFCAGDSCMLAASPAGGNAYKWMIGTTIAATTAVNTYAVYSSATYKVVVTDSNGCTGKTSTTSVKVTANAIPIATITALSSTTITATGNVKLNASPASGVSWQWLNNGIAITGATGKQYIATTGGSYTVAITKSGCTGTSAATVVTQLPAKEAMGITSDNSFSINAYPNPVSNLLSITISGVDNINGQFEMINYSGQLMGTWFLKDAQLSLDMSKYANGIYLLRYKDIEGRTGTLKIVKE